MKKHKHKNYKEDKKSKPSVISKIGKNTFSFIVIIFFFCFGWYGFQCSFEKVCGINILETIVRHNSTITTPNGIIQAEVVDTKSSRELGLSGRSSMREGSGMLFIFDAPGRYGFWMKDMMFPLDIIWINNEGIVVDIERNISPDSYPKTFINGSPATYVLEINAGDAEKNRLFIGSKVKIER